MYYNLFIESHTGAINSAVISGHSELITSIAIGKSESFVVSGSVDKAIRIRELANRKQKHFFNKLKFPIKCLDIFKDESIIASISKENEVFM